MVEKPLEILLIEDSPDDADLVLRALQQGGINFRYQRVETVAQMDAALDNHPWNLILSDYNLPHFSGRKALEMVQKKGLDLPFIVVSGKIGEEKAISFMKAGAHDYIMKNNLSRLVPAVQRELRDAEERRERRQAEAKLKETKNRLEKVLEESADAIGIVDRQGYFTEWNKMAERLYGYGSEEMKGMHFTRLYPDKEAMRTMLDQLRHNGFIRRYEIDMQGKDGGIAAYEISISLLRDADNQVVGSICVARDLSSLKKALAEVTRANEQLRREIEERQRAEKALEFERRRFYTILDELPALVHLQTPDYSIPFANRYFRGTLGDPEGKKCYQVCRNRQEPCDSCGPREVFATNIPVVREMQRPGGRVYQDYVYPFTDIDGSPLVLQLGIDITERKQAEEALQKAKEEWELTFDSVPDMIAILDREQNIMNLNKAMADTLEIPKGQAIGRKCFEVVHGLPVPPAFCPVTQLLGDGQHQTVEICEEKMGAFFHITVAPIFGRDGDLLGSVHIAQDITDRKKSEEALREQFLFLETLIDTIPNPIFYKDAAGKYLGCNRAFEKHFGTTRKEIVRKTVFDLARQDLAEKYHEMDRELLRTSGEQVYETSVRHADGSLHEVIFYKAAFRKADGSIGGLVGVMLDITPRKQMEQTLREVQAQQKAILDNIPDIAWLKDKEGRYIAANEPFSRMCGVKQEDLVGKTDLDLWPRELAEKYRRDDRVVMRTLNPLVLDEHIVDTTGELTQIETIKTPIFNDQGEVIGTSGIARDITLRKLAEENLRRTHREIKKLFESIPFMMIGLSPDGRISHWNREAAETLWVKGSPEVGEKLQDHCLSWEWNKVLEGLKTCRDKGAPLQIEDIRYRRPDGKDGFLRITFSPIKEEGIGISGLILLGREITEQRLLEAQLAQAQKLESIGQLAAGIAHEINTPIQYVGDNVRFLQEAFEDFTALMSEYGKLRTVVQEGEAVPEVIKELERVEEQTDPEYLAQEIPKAIQQSLEGVAHVAKIVRAMKDFSHPGTGEKTAVDINKAVESTITVARNEWKYVAEMVTDLDPALPLVPCLPDEFNQVLLNLIINAAHAIGEVVGKGGQTKGTISISTHKDGEWVEVRLKDTGGGIPEEIRSRVFDPFFTTKQVGKGTGQGLAISHSVIVDKHAGSIAFETEMGKGTTFIIRLPRGNLPT